MRNIVSGSLFALVIGAGTLLGSTAQAQEIRIQVAPPAPRVEVIGRAPSLNHVWVHGYWNWDPGARKHVWVAGRFEAPRTAGHIWYPARWVNENGYHVFVAGHWGPPPAATPVAVEAVVAPPAPQVEVIGAAPSANHFWIGGHWRWEGGRHVWEAGRWEVRRTGATWEPAHWAHFGHQWRFIPGHWR